MDYKVSVIIPVYGVENYIEKCIKSVLNQTLEELQIIIVDDYTKDKSIEIVEKIISNHPRKKDITIIRKDQNEGLAFARKTGLEYVKGDFIVHLDSDDYYYSDDILEKMYIKCVDENLDLLRGEYIIRFNQKGLKVCNIYEQDNIAAIKNILVGKSIPSLWTYMIKTQLYKNNVFEHINITNGEDWIHIIQSLYYSKNIGYIKTPVINYVQRDASATKNKNLEKQVTQILRMAEWVEIFLISKNIFDKSVYISFKLYIKLIIMNLEYDQYKFVYKDIDYHIFLDKNIRFKTKIKFVLMNWLNPFF